MKATIKAFLISVLAGSHSRTPSPNSQMRRYVMLLACVAAVLLLWSGCEPFVSQRLLSEESASWHGVNGKAVTLWLSSGTEELQGAEEVAIHFENGPGEPFWDIADFTVPVVKVEGQAVTLFFSHDAQEGRVLSDLLARLQEGEVILVRCPLDGVCG